MEVISQFFPPIALMVLVSFSVHQNTQSIVEDNHWVVHIIGQEHSISSVTTPVLWPLNT